MRPLHTVAIVKIKVQAANKITCPRLLLRTGGRKRRVSDDDVGASALMAHIRKWCDGRSRTGFGRGQRTESRLNGVLNA